MDAVLAALTCPGCGATLEPPEGAPHVRCRFCGALRRVPAPVGVSPRPALRAPVPLPRSIRVEETAFGVRLVRRWWHPAYLVFVLFLAVWFGALSLFLGAALRGGVPWFVALFPALHVVVGLLLAYVTLCGFVNRTTIAVERGELSVRHHPLPWPGAGRHDTSDLAQLFVRERSRGRSEEGRSQYLLCALTRGGATKVLVGGLIAPEQALYLEQELERRLGLADQPVEGQVG